MAEIKDKLEGLSQTAWAEVASEIEEESVIFLDDGASEILRWVFPGGAAALLEKGALNIYRLCKNPQRKRRSSSKFAQEDKLRASAPETIVCSLNHRVKCSSTTVPLCIDYVHLVVSRWREK
jgi:hypothetical protein